MDKTPLAAHEMRRRRERSISTDLSQRFDLAGSVAVVTGGSLGIGFETAKALGACEAKVILASRVRKNLDEMVGKLTKAAADASPFVLDVTDSAAVARAADAIVAEHGKVDIPAPGLRGTIRRARNA
jgi:NADP-dependent 3-hydroxy acid dehydrogenase YdfG